MRHKVRSPAAQMNIAWLIISSAILSFLAIVGLVGVAARFYYTHATQAESAQVHILSGSGALWRSGIQQEWKLIDDTTILHEGDTVSTALGTVAWITLFDGSTVEVSEDSIVHINRMRTSRFLKRTKDVVLRPEQGTIDVSMVSRGQYGYSQTKVVIGSKSVTMADEPGRAEAGSFLVEILRDGTSGTDADVADSNIRSAVLRGATLVRTGEAAQKLHSGQQVIIGRHGKIGPITAAVRQLLVNGDFAHGLNNWIEIHDTDLGSPQAVPGTVELRSEVVEGKPVSAIQFARATSERTTALTGIRQHVGQTLRVYSSLQFSFDLDVLSQNPPGGGPDRTQFPISVTLDYVDVQGEERQWTRGYYIVANEQAPVPALRGSQVDPHAWQHIVFDLNNLNPLPKQITALVVYASGNSYQSLIANLSLTSSESQAGD